MNALASANKYIYKKTLTEAATITVHPSHSQYTHIIYMNICLKNREHKSVKLKKLSKLKGYSKLFRKA